MVDSHILSVLGFVWCPCHLKLVIFEQFRPRAVAEGQSVDELGSCAKDHYKSFIAWELSAREQDIATGCEGEKCIPRMVREWFLEVGEIIKNTDLASSSEN